MALSPRAKLAAAVVRVTGINPDAADRNRRGLAPYFGAVLRGLIRREMDDATREAVFTSRGLKPTIGVSRDGILTWDREFVDSFAEDKLHELAYVLLHEVMHVILRHHERGEALGIVPEPSEDLVARATAWNFAGDACINEDIRKIMEAYKDAKLPAGWITPERLEQPPGLIAEERYHRLMKAAKKQSPGSGSKGKLSPHPGRGWCGGASGHPHPGEPEGGSKDGRSEAAMERMRKETAEAVRAAAEKDRGSVPDSLVRWADVELAPPKIPWREKLARVVRGAVAFKSGSTDLTWNRPSRRQAGVGFGIGRPVVPATHAPVPKVAVLVDTSGSMSELALQVVASELQGVLAATGANVTVATVDAELQGIRDCKSIQEAVGLFKGGGGTVLIHGWKALLERKPAPDVIIVCTDGYIGGPDDGYPAIEPKARVVWVVVGGQPDTRPCLYGDVIHVSREDVKEVA